MPPRKRNRRKRLTFPGTNLAIRFPADLPKVSAMILEIAQPLFRKYSANTPERMKLVIDSTIAGWNMSMFPPQEHASIKKDLVDSLGPADEAANAARQACQIMDHAAQQRQELFPAARLFVLGSEVVFSAGELKLDITSTPIPTPG